jgi:SPP1 family predicted phage head-tail adaptor
MINAGKYDRRITIYKVVVSKNENGFPVKSREVVLRPYASVKTTKGYTLIKNDSDFEKAYTNFTIRYPHTEITRDMEIDFNNKTYTIEYLNNVNEDCVELEIQAKLVEK